ncbi:glycosyltransferase family 2 protein [Candidatus Bathyarchaeota archaeon]|nr:MAG: glycosyltransferase family 2 protein [Candidatus Bathyarchaeota archaeon]
MKPKVSVILPAYNEEDRISLTLQGLNRSLTEVGLPYEVIIVNDGSNDSTYEVAVREAENYGGKVKVVGYGKNMGKGYALKTGFTYATGEIVIFMDSDMEITPNQLIHYVKALNYGDVVIASKRHPQSYVEMPLLRKFLSCCFNLLVKLFTGLRLSDTQAGLKAVKRRALEKIFPKLTVKRFAFDVEFLVVADLCGLKIIELPVNLHLRRGVFSFLDVWRMFLDLMGITYRLRVLKWYQYS